MTADCVDDENRYPGNATLYERSTRPMKRCVPLLTSPGCWPAVGGRRRLRCAGTARGWCAARGGHLRRAELAL